MTVLAEPYLSETGLWVFPRDEFRYHRFHYKPGQHAVFGGPSQLAGKTTLAFELLEVVATTDLPAYVPVSKPTDPVTEKRGKELGFRFVRDWPVPPKISEAWNGKPAGYVIWPEFGDINGDMQRAAAITARFMADRYTASARKEKRSAGIMVMDDTMVKAKVMHLDGQMVTILAMAGAMKIGLWIFIQKPAGSGDTALWGFENGTHFFLSKGGDRRGLIRYAEIAGDKRELVMEAVPLLRPYQFLYLNKAEGWICIVDAS